MTRSRVGMLVLALVTVAGGLLWIMGGNMAVHEAGTSVNGAPTRVFAYLTQPELLTRWIGGLVESKPLGDGQLRAGARSQEVIEENGRRLVVESEVTRVEAGRLLEITLTGDQFTFESSYRLEPAGTDTRVHLTLKARYHGIARFFAPFIRGAVQRKLEGDFERLRAVVGQESNAGNQASPVG